MSAQKETKAIMVDGRDKIEDKEVLKRRLSEIGRAHV